MEQEEILKKISDLAQKSEDWKKVAERIEQLKNLNIDLYNQLLIDMENHLLPEDFTDPVGMLGFVNMGFGEDV